MDDDIQFTAEALLKMAKYGLEQTNDNDAGARINADLALQYATERGGDLELPPADPNYLQAIIADPMYWSEQQHASEPRKNGHKIEEDTPPEPENLFGSPSIPPIDLNECLPPVLARFAGDCALRAGHSPAGYAYSAVAACCGAIPQTTQVRLGPTWVEPILIWAGLVGGSGTGKTPAMKAAVSPIDHIQRQLGLRYADELQAWKAEEKKTRGEPPKMEVRYLTSTTVEAAQQCAGATKHNLLRHADEGTAWLNSMGRWSASGADGERGDWLAAWNGQAFMSTRIGRGTMYLPHWGVAVVYGITPNKLRHGYAEAASDGMLARTLVCLLDRESWLEADYSVDPTDAIEGYRRAVERLQGEDWELRLSTEAEAVWMQRNEQWRDASAALEDVSPGLSSYAGKCAAMLARVAGLFHLLEAGASDWIGGATMERADKFMAHSLRMAKAAHLGVFGRHQPAEVARAVAAKILRLRKHRIARRELEKTGKFSSSEPAVQSAAIRYLAFAGWILEADSRRVRTGHRLEEATAWIINPLVHQRFVAEAEERKQEAERIHAALKGLGQ